jgi:hypothetical protein
MVTKKQTYERIYLMLIVVHIGYVLELISSIRHILQVKLQVSI